MQNRCIFASSSCASGASLGLQSARLICGRSAHWCQVLKPPIRSQGEGAETAGVDVGEGGSMWNSGEHK